MGCEGWRGSAPVQPPSPTAGMSSAAGLTEQPGQLAQPLDRLRLYPGEGMELTGDILEAGGGGTADGKRREGPVGVQQPAHVVGRQHLVDGEVVRGGH